MALECFAAISGTFSIDQERSKEALMLNQTRIKLVGQLGAVCGQRVAVFVDNGAQCEARRRRAIRWHRAHHHVNVVKVRRNHVSIEFGCATVAHVVVVKVFEHNHNNV